MTAPRKPRDYAVVYPASNPMLLSERVRFARWSPRRQRAHLALRRAYDAALGTPDFGRPLSIRTRLVMRAWRAYRRTWGPL